MSEEENISSFLGLSNTLTNSSEMLQEFKDRKMGIEREQAAAAAPPVAPPVQVPDYSKELEALRSQLDQSNRTTQDLRSQLDRQSGSLQQWMQEQSSQRQPQQPQVDPPLQVDDPALAAAINALDARNARRFQALQQDTEQKHFAGARQMELERVKNALASVREQNPEWAQAVTDEQIGKFIMPYVNNPRSHGMDWKAEFNLAAQNFKYPHLETENAELKKQLAQYQKQEDRNKAQQKQNLSKVPGVGQRSGGDTSSVPVGDQIMADYRKAHGRRKSPSFAEFGKELLRRRINA